MCAFWTKAFQGLLVVLGGAEDQAASVRGLLAVKGGKPSIFSSREGHDDTRSMAHGN